VLSLLAKTGLFSVAEHLEHNAAYILTAISCFAVALLLPYAAAQSLISASTAAVLAKAALSVTYVLSGLPQLAETVYAAVAGKIDTHVLMSLSVIGTLYMGMAQEVRGGFTPARGGGGAFSIWWDRLQDCSECCRQQWQHPHQQPAAAGCFKGAATPNLLHCYPRELSNAAWVAATHRHGRNATAHYRALSSWYQAAMLSRVPGW
jgi:hypothetical protein